MLHRARDPPKVSVVATRGRVRCGSIGGRRRRRIDGVQTGWRSSWRSRRSGAATAPHCRRCPLACRPSSPLARSRRRVRSRATTPGRPVAIASRRDGHWSGCGSPHAPPIRASRPRPPSIPFATPTARCATRGSRPATATWHASSPRSRGRTPPARLSPRRSSRRTAIAASPARGSDQQRRLLTTERTRGLLQLAATPRGPRLRDGELRRGQLFLTRGPRPRRREPPLPLTAAPVTNV